MKCRMVVVGGLAAALALAPVSSASARDHWHGGPLFWPFAAAAALVVGAATLVTLPIRAVAGPPYYPGPGYYAPPAGYAPAPGYYAPPQAYYPPPPGYYAPPPQAYYPPPQGYYPPPPGYAPYDTSPR